MSSNPDTKKEMNDAKKRIYGSGILNSRRSERILPDHKEINEESNSMTNALKKIKFGKHAALPKEEIKEE